MLHCLCVWIHIPTLYLDIYWACSIPQLCEKEYNIPPERHTLIDTICRYTHSFIISSVTHFSESIYTLFDIVVLLYMGSISALHSRNAMKMILMYVFIILSKISILCHVCMVHVYIVLRDFVYTYYELWEFFCRLR